MVRFIRGEIQQRIQDGSSILLHAADTLRMFGEKLKLSRIVAVPQAHIRPRPILDLLEKPDKGTPSVNNTADREVAPELIHFLESLPLHPPGNLGDGPSPGSCPVFKTCFHRCVSPWHSPAVPGGRIHVCYPIGAGRQRLHHPALDAVVYPFVHMG